jgi:hypothetical protein
VVSGVGDQKQGEMGDEGLLVAGIRVMNASTLKLASLRSVLLWKESNTA